MIIPAKAKTDPGHLCELLTTVDGGDCQSLQSWGVSTIHNLFYFTLGGKMLAKT